MKAGGGEGMQWCRAPASLGSPKQHAVSDRPAGASEQGQQEGEFAVTEASRKGFGLMIFNQRH